MTVGGRLRSYVREYLLALDAGHSGRALVGVVAMMLVAAALDLLGVGLVAPFVARVPACWSAIAWTWRVLPARMAFTCGVTQYRGCVRAPWHLQVF